MTDIRLTQASVEEWASIIPPQMQATQMALEMWAPVTGGNTQMLATQIAIEEWASVALAGAGGAQARIVVMA